MDSWISDDERRHDRCFVAEVVDTCLRIILIPKQKSVLRQAPEIWTKILDFMNSWIKTRYDGGKSLLRYFVAEVADLVSKSF